jgi:pyruvate formate-lyase/glycerol dehydratase family glycyl radical enzyme
VGEDWHIQEPSSERQDLVKAAVVERGTVEPWWERAKAPWVGGAFERTILKPGDTEQARIQTLREECLLRYEDGKRKISMQRARLVTESYRTTDGEHPAIRRAKAIRYMFENIAIPLSPHQLIAGTPSSELHTVEVQPEFLGSWDEGEEGKEKDGRQDRILRMFRGSGISNYLFSEEERETYEDEIIPYWRTRSRGAYLVKELKANYPEAWFYLTHSDAYMSSLAGPLYHTVQDYASILESGLEGIKAQIGEQIEQIDPSNPRGLEDFDRINHYRAMMMVADGLITYANRCADRAELSAQKEPDPERAEELREMARICRKVPAQPAESWWEALQSLHFLRMATGLAEGGNSHSVGRFDQYMYPYLRRDLDGGTLRLKRAQQLLECFFIKWNETQTAPAYETAYGVGNNDKLTIGGVDAKGNDCTNMLSYMVLEAHAHVHLNDPNVSVRLHRNTPDDFLRSVLEVIRLGGGLPILINDEVIVPALMANGVSLEDARNYADLGCQENITDPNMSRGVDTHGHTNAGWFNLVKPVELALFDGANPVNGVQVGPRTGDPSTFETMADFTDAVRRQYEYAVETNVVLNNVIEYSFARYYPCVFHNLMHPGPRRSGITMNAGGCKFNWTGALAVGTANVGDIMAAIDHLIYRNRETTWGELLDALQEDWAGYDHLRRRCIEAPKYGADDDWADGHLRDALGIYFDAYEGHRTPRGGRFVCGLITMSTHMVMGRRTGATPDGRKRGEPLADSTAPSMYAPALGPVSAHRSATKAIDTLHTVNGITFNQRLSLSSVRTERDLSKWADMVRTYIEAGGQSVQYTIADRETLMDAQRHPERYRDLVVRVGGYSALFTELSREIQDSIIVRVEDQL